MKKIKLLMIISAITVTTIAFAGCGKSDTTTPVQNSAPAAANFVMPNEDPSVFIKDMNQTITNIKEQTKLNKLEDAKRAAAELIVLNEKLSVHITEAKTKEELQQGVSAIRDEVQKPSPSQSAIEKSLQVVTNVLNQTSNQMKNHKHQ